MLTLVIGNRNYSSWSLRAWLYLTESGIEFQERRIVLFEPGWKERVMQVSPTGRVPVLWDDDLAVWDSWAIIEHARTAHGGSVGWPEDPAIRAHAMSVAAEMHAGFLNVRNDLPMNLRAPPADPSVTLARESERTRIEVERIRTIWTECLERHGGPFLFGDLTIADIMYAPVATRFRTYGVMMDEHHEAYVEAIFGLEGMKTWVAAAREETESIGFIDELAHQSPLHPG